MLPHNANIHIYQRVGKVIIDGLVDAELYWDRFYLVSPLSFQRLLRPLTHPFEIAMA